MDLYLTGKVFDYTSLRHGQYTYWLQDGAKSCEFTDDYLPQTTPISMAWITYDSTSDKMI